VQAGWDV